MKLLIAVLMIVIAISVSPSLAGNLQQQYAWDIETSSGWQSTGITSDTLRAPTDKVGAIRVRQTVIAMIDGNVVASTSTILNYQVLDVNVTRPFFIVQPESQVSGQNQTVMLVSLATGTLPISYQWQKNGLDVAGANQNTLTIASVQETDTGNYRCMASNSGGSILSDWASLTLLINTTITAPTLNFVSDSQAIWLGSPALLHCQASGGNLHFIWLRNGIPIPGAIAPDYLIPSVALQNGAQYQCFFWNDVGTNISGIIYLTILTPN